MKQAHAHKSAKPTADTQSVATGLGRPGGLGGIQF